MARISLRPRIRTGFRSGQAAQEISAAAPWPYFRHEAGPRVSVGLLAFVELLLVIMPSYSISSAGA